MSFDEEKTKWKRPEGWSGVRLELLRCETSKVYCAVVVVCVLFFGSPAKVQAAEAEEVLLNVGTDAEAEQSDEVGAPKPGFWGLARTPKQVVESPAGFQKQAVGSWGEVVGPRKQDFGGLARPPKQI